MEPQNGAVVAEVGLRPRRQEGAATAFCSIFLGNTERSAYHAGPLGEYLPKDDKAVIFR
jgi:hypothetical protein